MKKKTIIIIIVLVVIFLIIGFVMYKKAQDRRRAQILGQARPDASPAPSGGSSVPQVHNDQFPLKVGSRGPNVTAVQVGLNNCMKDKPMDDLVEDGIFGPLTAAAADSCLQLTGHVAGQVSYAEYQWLAKEAGVTPGSTEGATADGADGWTHSDIGLGLNPVTAPFYWGYDWLFGG